jgi:uncharacterized protein YndB with AHSA1/START domain
MIATVTFEDSAGKTLQTVRMKLASKEVAASMLKMGMRQGWSESLDQLSELLAQSQGKGQTFFSRPSPQELLFSRVYEAPRQLVFEAWTKPEHIVHWWGPKGFTTTSKEMNVRPSGSWRLIMRAPTGQEFHNRIDYLEVISPERLVYQHVGESKGHDVRFVTTTTFEDLGGKTRVIMRLKFETLKAAQHVIDTYHADQGGVDTLDRLGDYLTKMS